MWISGTTKPSSAASCRRVSRIRREQLAAALFLVDERDQSVADLELELVEHQRLANALLLGRRDHLRRLGPDLRERFVFLGTEQHGHRARSRSQQGEGQEGQTRDDRHYAEHRRHHPHGTRLQDHLIAQLRRQRVPRAGSAHDDPRRRRDHERRHLADESVADGERRVGLGRLAQRHALLEDADRPGRRAG